VGSTSPVAGKVKVKSRSSFQVYKATPSFRSSTLGYGRHAVAKWLRSLVFFNLPNFNTILYYTITTKKEQADKHTQGNNKNNEGKQHRNKTQMENMQSVTTWKKRQKKTAKQNPSSV
jgi:hypothetical protein